MKSNASVTKIYSTKPLVAAVALALLAPAAYADNGMPGAGLVVRNNPNITVNGIVLPGGNQIIGLNNGATIQNTNGKNSVIQWGSPAVLDTANMPGFNLAAGKTLNFTSFAPAGILNIDISGKLSKIDGTIVGDANTYLAVANEKGITVGSGAVITSPLGFAAIGANLNTIQAIDAFAVSSQYQMNFAAGAPVTVAGNLSAVGTYLLVAGSDAVNVSGKAPSGATVRVSVIGGVGSDANSITGVVTLNDNGPASATVRSTAAGSITLGYGTTATPFDASPAGHNLIAFANGDLTNNGVLEFGLDGPYVTRHLQWTGTLINNGTIQTTAAGTSLSTEEKGCASIGGSTDCSYVSFFRNTTVTPPLGGINNSGLMWAKDGHAEIVGVNGDSTNSGTILAGNGEVEFEALGGNVLNTATGTLHGTQEISVTAGDAPFLSTTTLFSVTNLGSIISDKGSVAMRAEYGSVTNGATGVITAGDGTFGDGDISLNANAESLATSSATVTNLGTLTMRSLSGFDGITLANGSPTGGTATLGGTVNTAAGGIINHIDVEFNTGANGVININSPLATTTNKGSTGINLAGGAIFVNAAMTVTELTPAAGAGQIQFFGTNNTGMNTSTIGANLTAGNFYFDTTGGGATGGAALDMNVILNGNLTTSAGGARTVEFYDVHNVNGPGVITANNVVFDTSGDLRNPVSNNYLLNGLHITTVGTNPIVTVNARAPIREAINLAITGNATVTSGNSVTNFGPCYSGLCITPSGGYIPEPNSGSSMLITATGNLTVGPNNYAGALISGGPGGLSNTNGFLFPGGVAFVAQGALNVNTVLDNAYTGTAQPFQGVYFEGATINALQPIYTNGNSFVNYSRRPNGGVGLSTTYQAKAGSNFLGFPNLTAVINPDDSFLNTYTVLANAVANGQDWVSLVSFTPIHQ